MKTVLLFVATLGALVQFGCASGPNQESPMRNMGEERKTAKQQAEFAQSLPKPD